MYSTHTDVHVYTRASPTDILARKSARDGQKSADKSARIVVRVARCADFRARIVEVGEEVRVGVGVGPVEFKL